MLPVAVSELGNVAEDHEAPLVVVDHTVELPLAAAKQLLALAQETH
jgi:hypothetical protein